MKRMILTLCLPALLAVPTVAHAGIMDELDAADQVNRVAAHRFHVDPLVHAGPSGAGASRARSHGACWRAPAVPSSTARAFGFARKEAVSASAGDPLAEDTAAHRWLANAEADHGGAIRRRRALADRSGAGAAA